MGPFLRWIDTLSLIGVDALADNGLEPEQHLLTHSIGCRKAYDARNPHAKRAYFQCLIAGDQLFQKGDKSNRSQAFYKLLLRDPAKAEAKLKAQECEKLVSAAERSVKLDALEAAPKRPRLELPPVPREGVEDEEEVFVGAGKRPRRPFRPFLLKWCQRGSRAAVRAALRQARRRRSTPVIGLMRRLIWR